MSKEIERKWIFSKLPENTLPNPIPYERHFLYLDDINEIRIQKKGSKFEFERKSKKSRLSRNTQKFEISKAEFDSLKRHEIGSIERESYLVDGYPEISIKKYLGKFQGLIRAEVEFESEEEAKEYSAPSWFGKEITNSPLGKDKQLIFIEDISKYLKDCLDIKSA